MQTIKASEFKAKCLHLMDEVGKTGDEIVITKNGKPVSILKAYNKPPGTLFARDEDTITSHDDLIEPVEIQWDVE